MKIPGFINAITLATKRNNSLILTVAAGAGTLATVYLTAKATWNAAEKIREEEAGEPHEDPKERARERAQLVWKLYIPPALSAGTTLACIVFAHRLDARKTLAAQAAFALTERAYSEYRGKVIDEFGERKDQAFRDSMAADRVRATAPNQEQIIIGSGEVLCCELHTDRYFMSSMQDLEDARNKLNAQLNNHDWQTLTDWYYLIGLNPTSTSSEVGWKSERGLMELNYSTQLTPDSRPCLTIDYNYYAIL